MTIPHSPPPHFVISISRRLAVWNVLIAFATLPAMAADAESARDPSDRGKLAIHSVGWVRPDILCVRLDEGDVEIAGLSPYVPQPGDRLSEEPSRTQLIREGTVVGVITGDEHSPQRFVRGDDRYFGSQVDPADWTDAARWSVTIDGEPQPIDAVYRKTRVSGLAERMVGKPIPCLQHEVFLKLAKVPRSGATVVRGDLAVPVSHRSQRPRWQTVSPSLHVSQIGFAPRDPHKSAFLGCWMGDGGSLEFDNDAADPLMRPVEKGLQTIAGLDASSGASGGFYVVDAKSGRIVHAGDIELRRSSDQPCDHRGLRAGPNTDPHNYAGTTTYEMDFSPLTRPGNYRVVVPGLGCSSEFVLDEGVYDRVRDLSMTGLAAHRWGVDLDLPLIDGTRHARPAAIPEAHQAHRPVLNTAAAYTNANFEDLVAASGEPFRSGDPSGNIGGGYMDAGDYDRNFKHHLVAYLLADAAAKVHSRHPDLSTRLIEAARFHVDLWVRVQSDDGGIPSAIEYSEHPRSGEPSYLNSLPVYVCAPSPESNLEFITATARFVSALTEMGVPAADEYLASVDQALQAYQREPIGGDAKVRSEREAWMHAELVRMGKASSAQPLRRELDSLMQNRWSVVTGPALMAAMGVLEMHLAGDENAKSLGYVEADFQRFASSIAKSIEMHFLEGSYRRSSYRALKNGWVNVSYGGAGWPEDATVSVIRWAWLGARSPQTWFDDKALAAVNESHAAAVAGMAYACGGNAINRPLMTGLTPTSVRHPLHCDTRFAGVAAPVGIAVYGPAHPDNSPDWPMNWHLKQPRSIYPTYKGWPTYENYHEFWTWAPMTEYTVHQTIGPVIYHATLLADLAKER